MTSVPRRVGVTVPIPGVRLHEHREWYEEIAALGFTDVWSGEASAHDGFTSLALAAAWAPSLRGGVAIAPVFTRGPALLAQTAASMAEASPGHFALGIGASSPAIVERWNAIPFVDPYARTRDVLRFLRRALAGEKVTERYETFEIQGFRLGIALEEPPPVLVAALRPRMLRLAGEEGDGAIVNWLSADDITQVAASSPQFLLLISSPRFARVSASLRSGEHHTDSALRHDAVSGPVRGYIRYRTLMPALL